MEASVLNPVRRKYFSGKGQSKDSRVIGSQSFLSQPNGLISFVRVIFFPVDALTLTSEGRQGREFKVIFNSATPRIKFGD